MFKKINKIFKVGDIVIPFLSVFRFVMVFIVLGASLFVYQRQAITEVKQFKLLEQDKLDFLKDNIEDISNQASIDLLIAASHSELGPYIEDPLNEEYKASFANEILNLSRLRKKYDQIRIIDLDGQELLRVNYGAGLSYLANDEELQNKADRYYFLETIKLTEDEMFISPLDLNVEEGKIEKPLKPVIRVGKPVFIDGEKKGIIIINYLAQELLYSLQASLTFDGAKVFLVNQKGYWFLGPSHDDEWGFMYGDGSKTIYNWNRELAEELFKNVTYQDIHDEGLFTVQTIKPFSGLLDLTPVMINDHQHAEGEQHTREWKLVSYLPKDILYEETNKLASFLIIIDIIIITLLITASIVLIATLKMMFKSEKTILKLNDTLKIITKVLRHDLANDFTHINFSLELFKESKKDKNYLKEIGRSAKHGIVTIGQMKELEGMVVEGKELKKVNIKETLDKIIEEYDIEINVSGSGSIQADGGLGSIFDNIISNAIRHGKTKKLDIKIISGKKKVTIKFVDYGKGVPKEIKEDIFKEGFKYGETGNTGLGLYIVAQTVKRYKGKIWVEDNKPKGAVFIIEFPISKK